MVKIHIRQDICKDHIEITQWSNNGLLHLKPNYKTNREKEDIVRSREKCRITQLDLKRARYLGNKILGGMKQLLNYNFNGILHGVFLKARYIIAKDR